MKARDLNLEELLELPTDGGPIRFAGQRALLMDAVALGLLRRELIERLGLEGARGVLTHFGWVHGWRTAEAMREAMPWEDQAEWRRAGGRLHTLQGLVSVETPTRPPEGRPPFAEAVWRDSYEAEQHLLHHGRADSPVCWSLVGFASGYLSCVNGRPIYCIEDRCVGRGDAACHVVGREKADWGPELEPYLSYFEAPCLDTRLTKLVEQLKQTETELRRKRAVLQRAGDDGDIGGLVTRSDAMREVMTLAGRVAKVDSTVLLVGESGSGKERVARFLHDESARASGAFVAVNCAAVTETLLESELFGHARGAFTGATSDRAGLFEAAQGGTLFLDEIGEITPAMQSKLLRVLQEREVRRVGENKSRAVDVRVVAATNRNLADDVAAGRFRKDLYYRLRVIEVKLPPLRDRRDDILPLARSLLASVAERLGRKVSGLTSRAADQLLRYRWPGNVRELENAMERAVALTRTDRVDLEDLPEEVRDALPGPTPSGDVQRLEDVERAYILAAFERNGGHQARTAEQLGIGTATLYRKLRSYGRLPSQATTPRALAAGRPRQA